MDAESCTTVLPATLAKHHAGAGEHIRRPVGEKFGGRSPARGVGCRTRAPLASRLVKIDVEGFEFDVLRGLEPLLDAGAPPAVLMELHPGLWGGRNPMWFEEFCDRHSLEVVPLFERTGPCPSSCEMHARSESTS